MSDVEGRLKITWPNTLALAKLADAMDFEAIVPVARWRGFGGKLNPAGPGFETYTWAAGIAASTSRSAVVATSHCSINHPITAAKQCTVIDHISDGRLMLNIVTGWNKPEIDMFGVEMLPHDERYDMAVEWLDIIKRLWTEDEEFDHEGKYYKIVKGYLQPKPIQQPFPAIMNAGGSERGRHFAAKYCDLVFIPLGQPDFERNKAQIEAYRRLAREEYGREVSVWTSATIVQAETEAEARRFFDYIIHDKGDWEAAIFRARDHRAQRQNICAGGAQASQGAFHPRLGRLPAGRHQGAGRRGLQDVVGDGARRRAARLAALRGRHAGVQGHDLSAARPSRIALINCRLDLLQRRRV